MELQTMTLYGSIHVRMVFKSSMTVVLVILDICRTVTTALIWMCLHVSVSPNNIEHLKMNVHDWLVTELFNCWLWQTYLVCHSLAVEFDLRPQGHPPHGIRSKKSSFLGSICGYMWYIQYISIPRAGFIHDLSWEDLSWYVDCLSARERRWWNLDIWPSRTPGFFRMALPVRPWRMCFQHGTLQVSCKSVTVWVVYLVATASFLCPYHLAPFPCHFGWAWCRPCDGNSCCCSGELPTFLPHNSPSSFQEACVVHLGAESSRF